MIHRHVQQVSGHYLHLKLQAFLVLHLGYIPRYVKNQDTLRFAISTVGRGIKILKACFRVL